MLLVSCREIAKDPATITLETFAGLSMHDLPLLHSCRREMWRSPCRNIPVRQRRAPALSSHTFASCAMAPWHACKEDSQSLLPLHPIRWSCSASKRDPACRQDSQPLAGPQVANRRKGSLGKRKASMDLELDRVLNAEVSQLD